MYIKIHSAFENHILLIVHEIKWTHSMCDICLGLILGLRLANERRCYFVTTSRIGWAQA